MSTAAQAAPQRTSAAFLALVGAMMLTGSNVPLGKVIVESLDVYTFLIVRFAVATLTLGVLLRPSGIAQALRSAKPLAGDLVVLSAIGSILFTVLLLEGTKRTSASDAGIITATLPAVVALCSVVVLREWPTMGAIACILVSVLGLVVIQVAGVTGAARTSGLLGNGLVLLAVVCEALFVLRSGPAARRLGPIALSFLVSAASLLLSLPLLAISGGWSGLTTLSPGTLLLAIWYGLSASVFCTILWYRGARETPAWLAGLATTALPLTAIAVSALWLGERLTLWQAVGAALVTAAIVMGALLSRGDRKRSA